MSSMRVRFAALTIAATSMLACSDGGDGETPPAPNPTAPTFTRVTKEVITEKSCGGVACHTNTQGGFQLTSRAALHTALVDQPAGGELCGPSSGETYIRVIPNDPENSLLYQKLDPGLPPCGDPMPPLTDPVGSEQLQLVYDWIAQGAKND